MEIIKEGKLPGPQLPWWAGVICNCLKCHAAFKLELSDHRKVLSRSGERASVMCPTEGCNTMVAIPVQRMGGDSQYVERYGL